MSRGLEGENPRHIGDPAQRAQPPGAAGAPDGRPRVLISRCLLGHRVRYDGRDKHQPALAPLLARWRVVGVCPELEAGLGVPRPPMDLVGPPGAARAMERASGRDLTPLMTPAVARLVADLRDAGLDGAVLKARSPSCGTGSAARYDRIDDPEPADRVDGVFAAALRGLDPPPRLADERAMADDLARARFALAVELRAALRAVRGPDGLDALWARWAAGPLGAGLRAAGLERAMMRALADDRATLVGHIDRAVDRSPATCISGVHPMNGS